LLGAQRIASQPALRPFESWFDRAAAAGLGSTQAAVLTEAPLAHQPFTVTSGLKRATPCATAASSTVLITAVTGL
jgi:hypothetical protein